MKDIDEIRRKNLGLIEQELGGPNEAAKLIGMSASQFTNLRKGAKDSKTGKPHIVYLSTQAQMLFKELKPLASSSAEARPRQRPEVRRIIWRARCGTGPRAR